MGAKPTSATSAAPAAALPPVAIATNSLPEPDCVYPWNLPTDQFLRAVEKWYDETDTKGYAEGVRDLSRAMGQLLD